MTRMSRTVKRRGAFLSEVAPKLSVLKSSHPTVVQLRNSAQPSKVVVPEPARSGFVSNSKKSASFLGKKEKSTSMRFAVGWADTQGKRPTMEDEIKICGGLRKNCDYVAIFDGHNGKDASIFASARMDHIIEDLLKKEKELPEQSVRELLIQSFKTCNQEMKQNKVKGGTTALVVLLLENQFWVANCGDTRAVLSQNGKATRISIDHRPDNKEEEERIRSIGGLITTQIDNTGAIITRVGGKLALSRSLGDFVLEDQGIIADPAVHGPFDLKAPENEFLVLACDGVWDVVSDEDAVSLVNLFSNPKMAAERLRDYSFYSGSTDNISVAVVSLNQNKKKM